MKSACKPIVSKILECITKARRIAVSAGLAAIAVTLLLALAASPALGANGPDTWGGTTNSMSTGGNWTGTNTPPISGDSWVFSTSGAGGANLINNLTGTSFNVAGITFNASASPFVIGDGSTNANAGNAFVLTGNAINSGTNLETINNPFSMTAVRTFTMTNGGGNITLGGNISGAAGGITTAGTGILTLSGSDTYTGATTVAGQTLVLGGTLNGTSGITVNNAAGYFNESSTGLIAGAATFTVSAGSATLAGANAYTGATTISGGTLTVGNGSTGSLGNTAITVGAGALTENASNALSGTVSLTVNGGAATLSQANNYSGATTVNGGTLNLNFAASGAPASNIINNATNSSALTLGGGLLNIGGSAGATNSQQFNGTTFTANTASTVVLSSAGTLAVSLGALTVGGNSTVNFALPTSGALTTTSTGNGSGNNNILVSSAGNGVAFATIGGTTWATLTPSGSIGTIGGLATANYNTGPASYSSTANIDVAQGDAPTGSPGANTLRFNSPTSAVTFTGTNTIISGGILVTPNCTGGSISGGVIQAGGGEQLLVINNGSLNIGSVITDSTAGSSSLALWGSGATTLSAPNTYTGATTLGSGTLVAGAASALGSGTLNLGAAATAPGNVPVYLNLTGNQTVAALKAYINSTGTSTINIASGQTLTVSNGLTVGVAAPNGATSTTNLRVTGGSLVVGGGTVAVGVTSANGAATNTLDLSGLAGVTIGSSTTPITNLQIGYGTTVKSTLLLSNTANTLTAATIDVGNSNGNNANVTSILTLGNGTNVLDANTVNIGIGKAGGVVQFAGTSGAVTISGTSGGASSANITLGNATASTYNSGGGINQLLLAGHTANVTAGTVIIAEKTGGAGGAVTSQVTFDTGTFNASSLQMALISNANAQAGVTGSLTVGGSNANSAATGVVNVSGNIILAGNTVTDATASNSSGSLTINGGTVNVNTNTSASGGVFDTTNSSNGSSSTTLTLAGGVLNLNSGVIGGTNVGVGKKNIGTLNFQAGTLENVAQINGGGGLTKSTTGTLVLAGSNSYTGVTNISGGVLNLGSAAALAGGGSIAFGGGTLQYSPSNQVDYSSQITGSTSAVSIDTNGQNVGFGSTLAASNTAGLTKIGAGTLLLAASQNYGGPTVINAGTLKLLAGPPSGTGVSMQWSNLTPATYQIGAGTAGALSLPNWNFSTISSGTASSVLNSASNTVPGMSIAWTGNGPYSSGNSTTNNNAKLLSAGLESNSTGSITISGIPYASYDLYVYVASWGGSRTGTMNINQNAVGSRYTSGTSVGFDTLANGSAGTATLNTVDASACNSTTYPTDVHFGGISGGSLTLNFAANSANVEISGIEIVNTPPSNLLPTNTPLTIGASATLDLGGGTQQVASLSGSGLLTTSSVASPAAFSVSGGSSTVFYGQITDSYATGGTAGSLSLTMSGAGMLTLAGSNTYSGATTISAGTLAISGAGYLGAGGNYAGAISNSGLLAFGSSAPQTFSGVISGPGSLAQSSGTLTLANNNTYSGATNVNARSLLLNSGSLNVASAVFVANGATFGGNGSAGTATVAAGAIVQAGYSNAGSLNLSALSFSGSGGISLGAVTTSYTSSAALAVSGNNALSTSGAQSITISIGSLAGTPTGTYELIGYSGSIGGTGSSAFQLASLPSRTTGYLSNPTGLIDLTLTGLDYLHWSGSVGTAWDASTANWTLNSTGGTTTYIDSPGDTVVFDDRAGANGTVNIASPVHPQSVTFSNTASNYILQGASGIAGNTGLTKNGAGSLTISNSNTYSGGTTINGGLLNINYAAALGSGVLTITGGTLDNTSGSSVTMTNGGQAWNGSFAFKGSSPLNTGAGGIALGTSATLTVGGTAALTVGGPITDNGQNRGLNLAGPGTLILAASNNYTGGTTISGGTLQLGDGAANNGYVVGNISNSSALTFANYSGQTYGGVVSGNGSLTKTAAGTLVLTATQNYSGPTAIVGGVLKLQGLPVGSIGVQFQGTGSAIGAASNGVVPMTNWNSFTDKSLGVQSGSLQDSTGKAGMAILNSFTGSGTYHTGSSIPLLDGYLDNYQAMASATISNIPYSAYSVYAYFGSDGSGRNGSVQLGSGATYYYSTEGGAESAYQLTTSTASSSSPPANYALWSGVTGTSFTLYQYAIKSNNGLNGIEIVNSGPSSNLLPIGTPLTIAANSTLDLIGGSQQIASLGDYSPGSGGSVINSATGTTSLLTLSPTGGSTTFSGAIQGANGGTQGDISLVKNGTGTQVLAGANTYGGATTVNAGVLQIGSSAALPNNTAATVNGTLDLNGFSATVGNLVGSGTIDTVAGGSPTLTVGSGNFSGVLQNTAGTLALLKTGPGTLTLGGANNYGGGTTIANGVLALGSNSALPYGNITFGAVGSSGTLDMAGYSADIGKLAVAAGANAAGQVIGNSSTSAISVLTSDAGAGNTSTFAGTIQDMLGSGTQKVGLYVASGTLYLTGPNTYSGATTVDAEGGTGSTLVLGQSGALSSNTPVTVKNGGIYATAFTTSGSTINGGGSLNLAAGSTLNMVDGAIDALAISGSLGINNGNLAFDLGSNGAADELLVGGAALVSGTNTISVAALSGATAGSYTLISAASGLGSNFALSSNTISLNNVTYSLSLGTSTTAEVLSIFLPSAGTPGLWATTTSGSGSFSWSGSGNWSNQQVPTSGTVTFAGTPSTPITVTLDGAQSAGALVFSGSNGYTLAPGTGGTLTLGTLSSAPSITVANGSHAISSPLEISGGSLAIVLSGSGVLGISGNISDDGGQRSLTLEGDGTGQLVLSGTDNTYVGGTYVDSGTLYVQNSGAIPNGSSLTVGAGGTFIFDPTVSGSAMDATSLHATAQINPVPEPGTIALLLAALWSAAIYCCFSRRRREGLRD